MADLKHTVNDESGTVDSAGNEQPAERQSYTVAKGRSVFKNGKTVKAGDTVELDYQTAKNFAAAGDIEGDFDEK